MFVSIRVRQTGTCAAGVSKMHVLREYLARTERALTAESVAHRALLLQRRLADTATASKHIDVRSPLSNRHNTGQDVVQVRWAFAFAVHVALAARTERADVAKPVAFLTIQLSTRKNDNSYSHEQVLALVSPRNCEACSGSKNRAK